MIAIKNPLESPLHYAKLSREELIERVLAKKRELNAVILGHNYQRVELQEISDYVGDSLGLSQEAAKTNADVIVFCGVHFMAETAKILSPQKVVLMPDLRAGCPMADFVTSQALQRMKAAHPEAAVVAYVNSTAAVKAESDICCTSANAVKVVNSIPRDRTIIFVPDRNLAAYTADKTGRPLLTPAEAEQGGFEPGSIIAWEGYCYVHDDLVLKELDAARSKLPNAKVVIHPEARGDLLARADFVVSTAGMADLAKEYDELIIGTERGIVDALQSRYPQKRIIPLSGAAVCGNMKMNTLPKLAWSLETGQHAIELDESVRVKAHHALQRMLELSGGWSEPSPEERRLEDESMGAGPGCGCA